MSKYENLCKHINVEFVNLSDEECEIFVKWIGPAVYGARKEILERRNEREEN